MYCQSQHDSVDDSRPRALQPSHLRPEDRIHGSHRYQKVVSEQENWNCMGLILLTMAVQARVIACNRTASNGMIEDVA